MSKKNESEEMKPADGLISANVAAFLRANSRVGSENLGGSLPQLKVVEPLSNLQDIKGEIVPAGHFYYVPTKEYFKELEVSIMTISRGFVAMDNRKVPKPKYSQIIGGMILKSMSPFVMFVAGTRLSRMWKFTNEIRPLTLNGDNSIPMFSLKVILGIERIDHDDSFSHVVTFKIKREDSGIQVIQDMSILNTILDGIPQVEDSFNKFIELKEVDRSTGKLLSNVRKELKEREIPALNVPRYEEDIANEDVDTDDIPF